MRDYGYCYGGNGGNCINPNTPPYHNVVLIDGVGQEALRNTQGQIVQYATSSNFDFIHGDATLAYNQSYWGVGQPVQVYAGQNIVQRANRYVSFSRAMDNIPPYFIIADDIQKDGNTHTYAWRFQSDKTRSGTSPLKLVGSNGNYLNMWFFSTSGLTQTDFQPAQGNSAQDPMGEVFSALSGSICDNPYQTEKKNTTPVVNPYFHVVLLPLKSADIPPTYSSIEVTNGSIVTLTWTNNYTDYSIFKYQNNLQSSGLNFVTDAKLSRVRMSTSSGNVSSFLVAEGTSLTYYGSDIVNLYGQQGTVMRSGTTVDIVGSGITYFRVYSPNTSKVTMNGASVGFVQIGDYVESNTVSVNRTWSGSIVSQYDVTVTSGVTLTINPASTLKFGGTGKKLLVNGQFVAAGTSTQPITITSINNTPHAGDWYGIQLMNGPSTLNYCTVSYAQYGVSVNTTSGVQIQNSTISNNSYHGVYEYNSNATGALTIQNSTLSNNNIYGLEVYNSYAKVSSSTISGNALSGVGVVGGGTLYIDNSAIQNNSGYGALVSGSASNAYFAANGTGSGFNSIVNNNTVQVYVDAGGSALLGYKYQVCEGPSLVDPGLPVVFSQCNSPNHWVWHQSAGANTIDGNYGSGSYFVYNAASTVVHADINYWPSLCPPNASAFSGSVSRDYPLCDDPTAHVKNDHETSGAPVHGTGGTTPETKEMYALISHCKNLINSNPDSAELALPMLAVFASPHGKVSDVLGMPWENFLINIEQNSTSSKLKMQALIYKIHSRLERGDYTSVFSLTDNVLQRNPNDRLWLFCQLERISAYLGTNNIASAEAAYASMKSRGETINVQQVQSLRRVLDAVEGTQSQSGSTQLIKAVGGTPNTKPQSYSLLQNYPDPFNPTTTIRYEVPENVFVEVKVFDVLGKEISTLVNEYKNAGGYEVNFDASKLPSGLYFYRLQAGKFSDVKKMLLLK